jgi:hypothetical protein
MLSMLVSLKQVYSRFCDDKPASAPDSEQWLSSDEKTQGKGRSEVKIVRSGKYKIDLLLVTDICGCIQFVRVMIN